MEVIAFNNPETGCLSYIVPANNVLKAPDESNITYRSEEEKEELLNQGYLVPDITDFVIWSLPKEVSSYKIMDISELPSDREYRNAWRLTSSGVVQIDLHKAKDLTLEEVREKRKEKLNNSDIDLLRELESVLPILLGELPGNLQDLLAKRMELRNVTDTIKQSNSYKQLKQRKQEAIETLGDTAQ